MHDPRHIPSAGPPVPVLVRAVAALQIAGSAAAAVASWSVLTTWVDRSLVELLAVAGVVGGVWLWRAERRGYRTSRWVQAAQVLRLKTAALTYLVAAGPILAAGVQSGDLALTAGVGASVYLAREPVAPTFVGVNLAAAFALAVLWWASTSSAAPADVQGGPSPRDT